MLNFFSKFPLLDKVERSFKDVVQAQNQVTGSLNASATPAFKSYATRHPPEMRDGLICIKEAYETQSEYSSAVLDELKSVPDEFELLRSHHCDISAFRGTKGPMYEKHEAALHTLNVERNALQRLMNRQDADPKIIDDQQKKVVQAEKEEMKFSDYDKSYERQFLLFEKRFAEILSKPIERMALKWAENSKLTGQLAPKFMESTKTFVEDETQETFDKLNEVLNMIDEQLEYNHEPTILDNNQISPHIKFLVQAESS